MLAGVDEASHDDNRMKSLCCGCKDREKVWETFFMWSWQDFITARKVVNDRLQGSRLKDLAGDAVIVIVDMGRKAGCALR